jgi:hypothetical protein
MGLRVRICRDIWGTWSVYGLSALPAAHLPSLSASLDYAREQCGAAPATIELLIDGFFAVIYQERGWPRRILAPEVVPAPPRRLGARLQGPSILSRLLVRLRAGSSRC